LEKEVEVAVASKPEVQGQYVGPLVGLTCVEADGLEETEEVEAEEAVAAARQATLSESSRRAYEGLPGVVRASKMLLPPQGQRAQWANLVLLAVSLELPVGSEEQEATDYM
jgi:hypothetical protein